MSWRSKWRRHVVYVVLSTLATWAIGALTLYLSYRSFSPEEQLWLLQRWHKAWPFLLGGGILLGLLMHSLAAQVYHGYILPLLKLADQTRWIHQGNLGHQIVPEGSPEARELAKVINQYAAEQAYLNRWGHEDHGELAAEEALVLNRLFCADRRAQLLLGPKDRVLLYNESALQNIQGLQLGRPLSQESLPMPVETQRLDQPEGTPWLWLKCGPQTKPNGQPCQPGPLAFAPHFADLPEDPAQWGEVPLSDLPFCCLDTETTGLNPSKGDQVIELGALRLTGRRLLEGEQYRQRFRPNVPISPESTKIHGIHIDQLTNEPALAACWPRFLEFSDQSVWLGHNLAFDLTFFRQQLGFTPQMPVLDSLCLAEFCLGAEWSLEDLAHRFGIDPVNRHQALGDAKMTALVFLRLLPLLAAKGVKHLKEATELTGTHRLFKLKY